ncbi:MAG: helix-turn-helix domain-containing protein [Rickettsiales bacterium]|jgi:transcriptional regulator with XRE-family HTH domain|nr:helix-turn-helix domain-containing protein [Rickettsiales bacterium]
MRAKTIFDDRYKHLIKQVVSFRIAKGITQRQLAEILKVPRSYVSRFEVKDRRLDVVELIDVCKALGIPQKEILALVKNLF